MSRAPGGQVIGTTAEHPFYVVDKGWTPVYDLKEGDLVVTADGTYVAVEEVWDTGEWEVVYNLRVSDHHTYFVGDETWGWSAWAHNTACAKDYYMFEDLTATTTQWRVFKKNGDGKPVSTKDSSGNEIIGTTRDDLLRKLKNSNKNRNVDDGDLYLSTNEVTANNANAKYGDYLQKIPGGKDQLNQKKDSDHIPEWQQLQSPPAAHAHHIVMKNGGSAVKSIVRDTQRILQQVGIDPIFGYDNLVWAPNWPDHRMGDKASTKPGSSGKGYAQAVYDEISKTFDDYKNQPLIVKGKIIITMQLVASNFITGKW